MKLPTQEIPNSHRLLVIAGAFVCAAVAIYLISARTAGDRSISAELAARRAAAALPSPYLPVRGGPSGFVSSETCKECHPKEHASWWQSHHRQMTQVMTTNSVKANFDRVALVSNGERFTMQHNGSSFWVDVEDLDEIAAAKATNGRPTPPLRLPMEMVTGSHYFQVFWLPGGFGNMQIGFPFTWLVQEKRWVERHHAFIRDPNGGPGRESWNQVCIRCHATGARPMPDQQNQRFNTHVTELGIACEACHGPAERHVTLQRQKPQPLASPARTPLPNGTADGEGKRKPDLAIVQPKDLDHVRSSQVCGFCHSMKWFTDQEGWKENGFRFRPGDDLETTTPIIRPTQLDKQPWLTNVLAKAPEIMNDFFWPDGMIRVAGREFNGLIESACYQRGKMGCISCHSMHQGPPDKQLKKNMESNEACFQCHADFRGKLQSHTHHQAESSGSLCYNCHMPYSAYGLLRGIRSHQIEKPDVKVSLRSGRPNACNQCHLDKTLEWTALRLTEWFNQPPPDLSADDRAISATVKQLIAGDAGQRALAAASMGWESALAASGRNWEGAVLAQALNDPYPAVRFIAGRSLGRLPGFAKFVYDFEWPSDKLENSKRDAAALWQQQSAGKTIRRTPKNFFNPDQQSMRAQ